MTGLEVFDALLASGKAVVRVDEDGEGYLSLIVPGRTEREHLDSDRAFVARMVAESGEHEDHWGTRKLCWQNRLAAIDEEIAALADTETSTGGKVGARAGG